MRRCFGQVPLSIALLFAGQLGLTAEPERPTGAAPESATAQRGEAYAHLMRSLFSVRRGEVGAAVDEIHQALKLAPDSPDLLAEAAVLLMEWTGRIGEAERLARRALELDDDHTEALRFLAELSAGRALGPQRDEQSRDDAIRFYEKLAAGDTTNQPEVLEMLVRLRHRAGDQAGALRTARRLVHERPGDLSATNTLAQLLLRTGEASKAAIVLLDYALKHPPNEELLAWAEQLTNSQQSWGEMVEYLDSRRPFPTDHPAIHHFYGAALLRRQRWGEAAESLQRALGSAGDELRIRKDLALAYRGAGRLADAAQLFGELAEESPEYPFLQQLLAETLADQRDVDRALQAYHTALRGLSGREEVAASHRDAIRHRVALLHLSRNELGAARAVVDGLEQAEDTLGLEIRARLAIEDGEWEEARKYARKLGEAGREGVAALLAGQAAVGEKKWSKAAARFKQAIDLLGPYSTPRVAEIYREADKPEEGLKLLRGWVEDDPELADARFHLGVYSYELDRFDVADRELREAFRLDPNHARALNFLGYSLAERGVSLKEALEMIERALEIDEWNGAYLDSLGWVYYQLGRHEAARVPLERAARELPRDPTVLEHLGDLYLTLGESENALNAWGRALEADPADPDLLRGKIDRELESAGRLVGQSPALGRVADDDSALTPR
jgi:tetratricopeptide (TPR) repeat protein